MSETTQDVKVKLALTPGQWDALLSAAASDGVGVTPRTVGRIGAAAAYARWLQGVRRRAVFAHANSSRGRDETEHRVSDRHSGFDPRTWIHALCIVCYWGAEGGREPQIDTVAEAFDAAAPPRCCMCGRPSTRGLFWCGPLSDPINCEGTTGLHAEEPPPR